MPPPSCDAGADEVIARIFKDCIYNFRDYSGFIFGLASILTWMVAQFPQVYSNYKNKSAEALSVWFLGEWLMGDTCNLIGCLLTGNQLITQIYTAMYFVCSDVVLCLQYVYYNTLRHRRLRAQRNARFRSLSRISEEAQPVDLGSSQSPRVSRSNATKLRAFAGLVVLGLGSQLLGFSSNQSWDLGGQGRILLSNELLQKHDSEWTRAMGQTFGWISSLLYLGSRLSQIYKNWRRQSAEGLSLAMFACAISANVFYGGGILLRTYSLGDLVSSAPWLVGSLGTIFLDVIIFGQFHIYHSSEDKRRGSDSDRALLEEEHPL